MWPADIRGPAQSWRNLALFDPRVNMFVHDRDSHAHAIFGDVGWEIDEFFDPSHAKKSVINIWQQYFMIPWRKLENCAGSCRIGWRIRFMIHSLTVDGTRNGAGDWTTQINSMEAIEIVTTRHRLLSRPGVGTVIHGFKSYWASSNAPSQPPSNLVNWIKIKYYWIMDSLSCFLHNINSTSPIQDAPGKCAFTISV
jgi:hypothetical protein